MHHYIALVVATGGERSYLAKPEPVVLCVA